MENPKKANSFKAFLDSLQQEVIDIETLEGDLKNKSKGKIRRFFSSTDYQKKQFKLYMSNTIGELKLKKEEVERKKFYLNSLCSIDFDLATNFIARTLSTIEGEKYRKIALCTDDYDDVCLITTLDNARLIVEMNRDGDIDDTSDIQNAIEDDKFVLLETEDTYTFFDYENRRVPYELTERYPYLTEVIIDFISFRLENPTLNDEQSALITLDQIPEKYAYLIKTPKTI